MVNNNKKKLINWSEPVKIAIRFSVWIVFPVFAGYILGSFLDKKYNSSPVWFIIVIGFSFVISMLGLVRTSLAEYKKIENNEKNSIIKEKKN